jgi:hypothetical protein
VAARCAQCREPTLVGVVAGQQQRVDGRTPAGEARTGIEHVAAIVTGPDEQDDPRSIHLSEHLGAGGRQPGRRPLHKGAGGQPGHQSSLGRSDDIDCVG